MPLPPIAEDTAGLYGVSSWSGPVCINLQSGLTAFKHYAQQRKPMVASPYAAAGNPTKHDLWIGDRGAPWRVFSH